MSQKLKGDSNSNIVFAVDLDGVSSQTQTANWFVASENDDTAEFGEDYALTPASYLGVASIPAGATTAAFNVSLKGDDVYEVDETFTATLFGPSSGTSIGDRYAQATIINDDPVPTLTTGGFASVNEADENLSIALALSNPTSSPITLRYATSDGTATGGEDFVTQSNQLLTIPPLATASTIKIPITNDDIYEGAESFIITLSNINNAVFPYLAETQSINVVINESKLLPQISFVDRTPSVSESGSLTIGVQLNHASADDITVFYSTASLTAVSAGANADFNGLANQRLDFAAGEVLKNITVTTNQDTIDEGNETFEVQLRQPSNATLIGSAHQIAATVTIADDDSRVLSFTTTNFSHRENAGPFLVDLALSTAATTPINFDYAIIGRTAGTRDYTVPTTRSLQFNPNVSTLSINIPIRNDGLKEGNETFEIVLSNLTGARFSNNGSTLNQIVTIVDDERPLIEFKESRVSVNENVTGGVIDLEFKLSGPITTTSRVTYTTSTTTGNGLAAAGTDFTAPAGNSAMVTLSANQTTGSIRIPILNDANDEPDETFTVALSAPNNADLGGRRIVTVVIIDDDIPTFSISPKESVKEATGATADFTITTYKLPYDATAIRYKPVSTTFLPNGISGEIQTSPALTFTRASSTDPFTATLSVSIDQDNIIERNSTITVALEPDASENAKYLVHAVNNSATVNVEDDDTKVPVLGLSGPAGVAESDGSVEITVTAYQDQTRNKQSSSRSIDHDTIYSIRTELWQFFSRSWCCQNNIVGF